MWQAASMIVVCRLSQAGDGFKRGLMQRRVPASLQLTEDCGLPTVDLEARRICRCGA